MFERYVVDCCVIPYVIQDIYCMMQSSQVDLQAESERPQASPSRRWGGGGAVMEQSPCKKGKKGAGTTWIPLF